jgi:hypothetical protein
MLFQNIFQSAVCLMRKMERKMSVFGMTMIKSDEGASSSENGSVTEGSLDKLSR